MKRLDLFGNIGTQQILMQIPMDGLRMIQSKYLLMSKVLPTLIGILLEILVQDNPVMVNGE